MSDSKTEEDQTKIEEKQEEKPATSEEAGFGGFGVASSWLNQGQTWGASFLNTAREKVFVVVKFIH